MTLPSKLQQLREFIKARENATPGPWGPYSANEPFYAIVKKPSPSLSKHEGTRRGEHMWRVEDAQFVGKAEQHFSQVCQDLIIALEALEKIGEARAKFGSAYSDSDFIALKALERICRE